MAGGGGGGGGAASKQEDSWLEEDWPNEKDTWEEDSFYCDAMMSWGAGALAGAGGAGGGGGGGSGCVQPSRPAPHYVPKRAAAGAAASGSGSASALPRACCAYAGCGFQGLTSQMAAC